jgi:hypothetical protein
VQHYGFRFDYVLKKAVDDGMSSIPEEMVYVPGVGFPHMKVEKSEESDSNLPHMKSKKYVNEYDQLTVNEYHPGVGIAAHVETHSSFEENFTTVSLLDEIVMDFKIEKTSLPGMEVFDPDDHVAIDNSEVVLDVGTESESKEGSKENVKDAKNIVTDKAKDSEKEKLLEKFTSREFLSTFVVFPETFLDNHKVHTEGSDSESTENLKHWSFLQKSARENLSDPTNKNFLAISLQLPRRSRATLGNAARFIWKHAIGSRTTDLVYSFKKVEEKTEESETKEGVSSARASTSPSQQSFEQIKPSFEQIKRGRRISLTYRKLKKIGECSCDYPLVCDIQNPDSLSAGDLLRSGKKKGEKGNEKEN